MSLLKEIKIGLEQAIMYESGGGIKRKKLCFVTISKVGDLWIDSTDRFFYISI